MSEKQSRTVLADATKIGRAYRTHVADERPS